MRGKRLINETTVETVVSFGKNYTKPKDYIQIGIDAEDYYRIKDSEKVETDR
jgi:23S rRNA (uracil1939-C5)-methyltransferase